MCKNLSFFTSMNFLWILHIHNIRKKKCTSVGKLYGEKLKVAAVALLEIQILTRIGTFRMAASATTTTPATTSFSSYLSKKRRRKEIKYCACTFSDFW